MLLCFFGDFAAQGFVQPGSHVAGKFDRFRITKNIYRQLRLIHHYLAIFAMLQVPLQFLLFRWLECAIDKVRNLANDAFAIQCVPPCRK